MELSLPSPKQARSIRESTARINIWHGSVRSGKTIASLLRWASVVEQHKGTRDLLMVGKTERTLMRNALVPLEHMLGPQVVEVRRGSSEATIFGRVAYLVGANDERAEQKIRGGTFSKVYGDELSLWPESFFRMCLSRMSPAGAQLFGTTNPDSPRHYLKRDFIDRADELDLAAFHFTLADNQTLDPAYVAAISKEYTGLWRKRFVEGLWVVAEGAIWDMLDPDLHCPVAVPEGVKMLRYFAAVDYGTSNPFVAGLFGEATDGRTWLVDRWRWDSREAQRQLTDAQYSKALADWLQGLGVMPAVWYVDPSAASFILQLRQDHNWDVVQADNDVEDGLRTVANMLADDTFRMLAHCEDEIRECQGYCWDPKHQEKGIDAPVKQDDHGPDMIRYALHTRRALDIGDISGYGWIV